MRSLLGLAFAAALIAAPAFAQGTITVEKPWARATPAGAMTGAVYMTLDNASDTADRLTGASCDIAGNHEVAQRFINETFGLKPHPGSPV